MSAGETPRIAQEGTGIEATLTRWAIGILGASIVVIATVAPWFAAYGVAGYAEMAGWGAWRRSGEVDASLRPLPLAVLVYLTAGLTVWGAVRPAFGASVIGAMATFGVGLLPLMLLPVVDRHAPGRDAVGVEVASATTTVIGLAVVLVIVSWIGYARCVLRPAPRAGA